MKHPKTALIFTELFPRSPAAYVAFRGILVLGILYVSYLGALAVWPDSLYFADRARHVIEQGSFSISAPFPSTPPLYSLLLVLGFIFPDLQTGHHITVILQALLIASAFFPLRALLVRGSALGEGQATPLAAATLLLPCFFSYAPLVVPEALSLPLLVYGVYFLDRILAGSAHKTDGIGAGLCLGLAWLTLYSAGIVWLAALITLVPALRAKNRAAMLAMVIPLAFFVPWFLLNAAREGFIPDLSLNNLLARFNFGKNAVLYFIYGGAPLAGAALILSGILKGKTFWQNSFLRFALTAFIALAVFAALTNTVIVERKLDYFTNRLLEPYLFIPLIALFRLEPGWRKDLLANSLLLFFVLLIFGLPMNLHLDFQSGLAFWDGHGTTPTGIIRDILYALLIALPVVILFWRPAWFAPVYLGIVLIMAALGLGATAFVGSHGEDAKIARAEAQNLHDDETLRKSDIYAEYRCKGTENNDVAYLFGCYDVARTLYFLPHLSIYTTAGGLKSLPQNNLDHAVFISTETDNAFGPVIARQGLARFQKLDSIPHEPFVQIRKITGMREYITMPFMDRDRRLTLLNPSSEITLNSSSAGCMRMETEWFMDSRAQPLSLQLNKGPITRLNVSLISKGPQGALAVRLDLPKGDSILAIHYGDAKAPHAPSLIMFDRPVFKNCGGKG